MNYYRQGDIAIIPVKDRRQPSLTKRVEADNGRIILAYGEVTGHAHALPEADVELYETANAVDRFLRINSATVLSHEEHAAIALPAGDYIVRRQREYAPDELRLVAD